MVANSCKWRLCVHKLLTKEREDDRGQNMEQNMEQNKNEKSAENIRRRSRRNDREQKKSAANLPYIGIAALAVILTLGGGVGFYLAKAGSYRETFLPNTTINGMDVAGKSIEDVKAMLEAELNGYELTILERTGAGEVITKEEIGLRTEFDGGLEQVLELQEPMFWMKSLWTEVDYKMETLLVYDEARLETRLQTLSFMEESRMQEPQDAYLSEYQESTNSYEIIPETAGTELVKERVQTVVSEAIRNLQTEVDLDEAGCYVKAAVCSDDLELTKLAAELNCYVGASVTHVFGDNREVLDGSTIHEWLSVEEQSVVIDETKAAEYVKSLAKKYNTAYEKRPFLSTYGTEVTIPGGSYGWRMNQTAETEAVLADIREGAVRTREPEWIQKGASHGTYDYGTTYVEVNLTAQHLFFYKDGKLLVECDFVSGNAAKGWSTPAGIYPLTYKERNATLKGEGYSTPVSYWMPFNGGIGLHDASWRSSFGGTVYKNSGSHGCVNLPPSAAKIIFEHISKGDPVICYHLEGTESKQTSKPGEINTSGKAFANVSGGQSSETKTAETKPSETKPEETKPSETTPAETTPAEILPEETLAAETLPTVPEETGALTPETSAAEEIKPEIGPGYSSGSDEGYGPGYSKTPNAGDGPGAK